ncbi:MAG: hypothetical protein TRG1_3324 [Flavobacteriaceae bacterium FS1-H7996/R]|nr:MAG: hypothetical protein TRG1_3324 [Flavobacteriaceae bacterium FS1-H7996/R]
MESWKVGKLESWNVGMLEGCFCKNDKPLLLRFTFHNSPEPKTLTIND